MTDEEIVAIRTLAKACEAAGITVAQMIAMLREDLSIKNLLYLIERDQTPPVFVPNSSRWLLSCRTEKRQLVKNPNFTQYQKAPTFAVRCESSKQHTFRKGAPL